MRSTIVRLLAVLGVFALLVAACSDDDSSDSSKDDTTTTEKQSDDTTTTKADDEGDGEESPQKATAAPTEDLQDGTEVVVTVEGFTAGLTIGINQCAEEEGDPEVGADDCDLSNIVTLDVGPDGTGSSTIRVKKTLDTQTPHTCTGTTRCFLSVGELTPEPDAERSNDVNLTFAA